MTCPTNSVTPVASTNRISGDCYDANGNLLAESAPPCPSPTYTYDGENRMVNYSASGTYTYDGNGLRVKKVSGSTTTVYVFSGSKVIAEYDNGAAVGSPSREYVYGGSRLLAKIDSSGTKYYHQDHLSNRLVTSSTGTTLAQMGHFPFGESWYNATGDKLLFTTYERDAESGNDYAQARYNISRLARFASLDSAAGSSSDPQSLNKYAYVGNDPTDYSDPGGMEKVNCTINGADGFCPWIRDGGGGAGGGYFPIYSFFSGSYELPVDRNGDPGYVTVDWGQWEVIGYALLGGNSGGGGGGPARAQSAVIAILGGNNPCADFFNGGSTNAVKDFASTILSEYEGPNYLTYATVNGQLALTNVDASVRPTITGQPNIIDINTNGSFYQPSIYAYQPMKGLPSPPRVSLPVGSYPSGSFGAQVGLLLHEFAHILQLIPNDPLSVPGQSATNQATIEKHCKSAIDQAIKGFGP